MKVKTIPELENLSELVGEFMEYWGFKKIHGKIWLHIYLSEHPLDAKDLMARLKISKALVSISIRDLLEFDVIFEGNLSAEGTRTYTANRDTKAVLERVLRGREKVMMSKIKGSFQNLKQISTQEIAIHSLHPQSIKDLEKLINKGDKMLSTLMAII